MKVPSNRTEQTRRDDGFTVVEVVFAAAILFFAVTALVGLMGTSSRMSATSRARTVLVNEIATRLDRYRAMPFDRIALTTAVPPGDLLPSETITSGGFTITLHVSVTDRISYNGTKEIHIDGVITQPGVPDVRTSSFAAVRDRVGGTTTAISEAPTIKFLGETPAAESIVFNNQVSGGGALNIATRSESVNFYIQRVEYLIANTTLKDGATALADPADHDFSGTQQLEDWSFIWNTKQVDAEGRPVVSDGRRVIRVVCYDDQGRASVPQQRVFVVDNYPPAMPGNAALAWTGLVDSFGRADQRLTATWTPALDGTDPAPKHTAEVYKNVYGESQFTTWASVLTTGSPTPVPDSGGFDCYAMRVQALSPLGNPSDWAVVGPILARPTINGSCDVTRSYADKKNDRWSFVNRFELSRPRFPYSPSSVTVKVLRYDAGPANPPVETDVTAAALSAWSVGSDFSYADTTSQLKPKTTAPTPPPYRVVVTISPNGWGSTSLTVLSNYVTSWFPSPLTLMQYTAPATSITVTSKPLTVSW